MLSGFPPFYGENDIEVFEQVLQYQYDFDDEVWDIVSNDAKDLITNLLKPKKERYSCKQALAHPFITKHVGESQQIDENMSQ